MGFLKKITRPISRVLDKIVPNEIKPALPFLAAAAPFMAPGIMGAFGNSMLSRGLISGGLNLGAQLAQEGSEGEFDALSLAMASGIGALSAPGTKPVYGPAGPPGSEQILQSAGTPSAGEYLRGLSDSGGITDKTLNFLGTGADKLVGLSEGLAADGILSKAGAKALSIPLTQGTMDLATAENRRLEKQQAIDDALASAEGMADSAARAAAIRNSMTAYGFFTDEEIEDTIASAGYKTGGRVGFEVGGLSALLGSAGKGEEESKYITKKSDTSETVTINRIHKEQGGDGLSAYLDRNPNLKDKYVIVADGMSGELTVMPNKLHPDFMDKESIILLGGGDGSTIEMSNMFEEKKAKGGRVGFDNGGGVDFGGIPAAIKNVEAAKIEDVSEIVELDDLSKLDGFAEMLSNMDESDPKYNEIRKMGIQEAEMVGEKYKISPVDLVGYLDKKTNMFNERTKEIKLKEIDDGKKEELMEKVKNTSFAFADGGLMNLGGREMDMRGGGFIPIGKKERADDVPARLSKNEFVMTADAVRAAGGGSVNKGAKRMYDLMNNLEARV